MLRRVIEGARLIDHVRQIPRMPRRKTIMPAWLNMQQFVEGISIRQPGRALLVSAKQVPGGVDRQADCEPHTRRNRLPPLPVRRKFLYRPAHAVDVVAGLAGLLVHLVLIHPRIATDAEINIASRYTGNAKGTDPRPCRNRRRLPATRHRLQFARTVTLVPQADHPPL